MPLTPGTRLGAYEITGVLGAGGMGEVYRARDSKLKRDVALKLLPDALAGDPDRLARFEREAQVLASLNHPHIAAIHGFEQGAHTSALVMELVEGEDLSQRIARGPIPLDEALPIARQIAHALEAAHDAGIVHRDLKPANIKVRADGAVKVLDFGLAKAIEQTGSGREDLVNSPTITSPALTGAGIILGTAAYMSPEQAKGKTADRRADVWAFGVVLYEMLTGRMAFAGDTIVEVLGGVVKSDPDWRALPADTPSSVMAILRRCLEKNPELRLRDIREARLQLEGARHEPVSTPTVVTPATTSSRWPLVAAIALALLTSAAALVLYSRPAPPLPPEVRFEIPISGAGVPYAIAVSPDGGSVVYSDDSPDSSQSRLWVRALDSTTPRELPDTVLANHPVWSPDGGSIAYVTSPSQLMRLDLAGGAPKTLATGIAGRCAWSPLRVLVCTDTEGRLVRVADSGGAVTRIRDLDRQTGERSLNWPSFLPDGRSFLYLAMRAGTPGYGHEIRLGSIDSTDSRSVMPGESMTISAAGHVFFMRGTTLIAQRFDEKRGVVDGDETVVGEHVPRNPNNGRAAFDVSTSGTVSFRSEFGDESSWRINWINQKGDRIRSVTETGRVLGPALSPNGQFVAYHRIEATGGDVWITDTTGARQPVKLTFDSSQESSSPIWSPDGSRVVYRARRGDQWGLYEKAANGIGAETLLTESRLVKSPMSWSGDGRFLAFMTVDPATDWDIWVYSFADKKAFPVLNTRFREGHPQFSPDGQWLSYSSNETAAGEIYVQSFPPGQGKWQVSTNGGTFARWRGDGKELLYLAATGIASARLPGTLIATTVTASGNALEFGPPRKLFDVAYIGGPVFGYSGNYMPWTMTSDGSQFLFVQPENNTRLSQPKLTVIANWRPR